jgi:predicted DNA binding CopG/RHH family protein
MSKMLIESKEEINIINDVEEERFESVTGKEFEELKHSFQAAAKNTIEKLSKRKSITIRLLESDIDRLKAIALNEGMPYQTYISHIIHKVTTGQIKAR